MNDIVHTAAIPGSIPLLVYDNAAINAMRFNGSLQLFFLLTECLGRFPITGAVCGHKRSLDLFKGQRNPPP